jgi:hypothetical protein
MNALKAWLQQPTSVAGLATIFGTLSGFLTRQLSAGQAVPLIAAAMVSILIPDNSTDPRNANLRVEEPSIEREARTKKV